MESEMLTQSNLFKRAEYLFTPRYEIYRHKA